ncbi:MAG: serine--tRNA ligase, partial [Aquificaceae bacterium]|nr:serine--tRNA ligase [Aquificaceae bacterium]
MLDIELIRKNPELVRKKLASRDVRLQELVDVVLELDAHRRSLLRELEGLRAERNAKSKEIGLLKKKGEDTTALEEEVRSIKENIESYEKKVSLVEAQLKDAMLS